MQERLYVLIDQNLNPIYGCVQGGHAVAQWIIDHPNQKWNNQYLIYLSANIIEWKEKLNLLNRDFSLFKEPDLNNKRAWSWLVKIFPSTASLNLDIDAH